MFHCSRDILYQLLLLLVSSLLQIFIFYLLLLLNIIAVLYGGRCWFHMSWAFLAQIVILLWRMVSELFVVCLGLQYLSKSVITMAQCL